MAVAYKHALDVLALQVHDNPHTFDVIAELFTTEGRPLDRAKVIEHVEKQRKENAKALERARRIEARNAAAAAADDAKAE